MHDASGVTDTGPKRICFWGIGAIDPESLLLWFLRCQQRFVHWLIAFGSNDVNSGLSAEGSELAPDMNIRTPHTRWTSYGNIQLISNDIKSHIITIYGILNCDKISIAQMRA